MPNLLFLVTLFPGLLLFFSKKIPNLNNKSTFFQYLFNLSIVSVANMLFFKQYVLLFSVICILILPRILIFIEYIFLQKGCKNILFLYKKNRVIIDSIVSYPLWEEVNFRFYIYQFCIFWGYNQFQFLLLSTLAFVVSHIFYQGNSSVIKIIFASALAVVFIVTRNVFITILIHNVFNFYVYMIKVTKYGDSGKWS